MNDKDPAAFFNDRVTLGSIPMRGVLAGRRDPGPRFPPP